MELTRRKALELSVALWKYLAQTGSPYKSDFIENSQRFAVEAYGWPKDGCWMCELYRQQRCHLCPLYESGQCCINAGTAWRIWYSLVTSSLGSEQLQFCANQIYIIFLNALKKEIAAENHLLPMASWRPKQ